MKPRTRDPLLIGLLITVALLFALNVARPLWSPPTSYAAGTFHYKTVDYRRADGESSTPMEHIETVLNQHGQEGWELVQMIAPGLLIFKKSP